MFIRRTHSNNIGILQPMTEKLWWEITWGAFVGIGVLKRTSIIVKAWESSIIHMSDMSDIIQIWVLFNSIFFVLLYGHVVRLKY